MPPLLRTGCDPAGQDGGLPDSVVGDLPEDRRTNRNPVGIRRIRSGRPARSDSIRTDTQVSDAAPFDRFQPNRPFIRHYRPPIRNRVPNRCLTYLRPYAVKSLIFHIMCYSNHHHRFRDKADPAIRCAFLREGQSAPLSLPVWYDLAHRIWGISYKSYLSALRKDVSDVPDMPPQASEALKALIGSLLHNAPEWKRKRYVHRAATPRSTRRQERPRNRTAALEPFRR